MGRIQNNAFRFTKADFESRLRTLTTPKELSEVLNKVLTVCHWQKSRPAQLKFFADTTHIQRRVHTFKLPKKHGGTREITAPKGRFRYILSALYIVLQTFEEPTQWAYGFVRKRSVVDNARPHVGKRYVLHFDLKDYFPSITRQRVEECLTGEPFLFSVEAAQLISGLCAVRVNGDDVLAQGFSTSPLLSNFVCRTMDEEIAALAATHGITYSRYADDLTFSADTDVLRPNGAFALQVKTLVEKHQFRINEKKTHLQRRGKRQDVTGIIVTEKVNIPRRYVREMRNILYVWERYGYVEAHKCYRKYARHQHGNTKPYFTLERVLQGKLNYISMVRGKDDVLYLRLQNRFNVIKADKPNPHNYNSHPSDSQNSLFNLFERQSSAPSPTTLSGTADNPERSYNFGILLLKWAIYILIAFLLLMLRELL